MEANKMEVYDRLFDDFLSDKMPTMKVFYPVVDDEKQRDIEQTKEMGFKLMYLGLMFSAVLLTLLIFTSGAYIGDMIGFYFIYLFAFFSIAIKSGGIKKVSVKGIGKTRPLLEDQKLSVQEAKLIDEYCSLKQLPPLWKFKTLFSFTPKGRDDRVYAALLEDFKTRNTRPFFEVHDTYFDVANANAPYIGLFFFMSMIYFVLFLVDFFAFDGGLTKTVMIIVILAIVEECAKGVGYFVTPTLESNMRIAGITIKNEIGKGLIAGCGFAFAETLMRLQHNVNPVENFIIRLPTLGLHMIASAVFFVGISWMMYAREKNKQWAIALGIIAMAGACLLHIAFNMTVWWLFG